MNRRQFSCLLLAVAVGLGLLDGCRRLAPPQGLTGRVVRIIDGDTIEVLMGQRPVRVRLYGVDCPERSQAFGTAARRFTSELCFGQTVRLLSHGTDRYGRLLADVVLADGRVVNQELVRAGLAWWYREFAPEARELEALEQQARARRLGLWADPQPLPPWEFRRSERAAPRESLRPGGR